MTCLSPVLRRFGASILMLASIFSSATFGQTLSTANTGAVVTTDQVRAELLVHAPDVSASAERSAARAFNLRRSCIAVAASGGPAALATI